MSLAKSIVVHLGRGRLRPWINSMPLLGFIFMGLTDLQAYWNKNFYHPFVTSIFTRDRFASIFRIYTFGPRISSSRAHAPRSITPPNIEWFIQALLPTSQAVAFRWKSRENQAIHPYRFGYKIYCLSGKICKGVLKLFPEESFCYSAFFFVAGTIASTVWQ